MNAASAQERLAPEKAKPSASCVLTSTSVRPSAPLLKRRPHRDGAKQSKSRTTTASHQKRNRAPQPESAPPRGRPGKQRTIEDARPFAHRPPPRQLPAAARPRADPRVDACREDHRPGSPRRMRRAGSAQNAEPGARGSVVTRLAIAPRSHRVCCDHHPSAVPAVGRRPPAGKREEGERLISRANETMPGLRRGVGQRQHEQRIGRSWSAASRRSRGDDRSRAARNLDCAAAAPSSFAPRPRPRHDTRIRELQRLFLPRGLTWHGKLVLEMPAPCRRRRPCGPRGARTRAPARGYDVELASDGDAALAAISQRPRTPSCST